MNESYDIIEGVFDISPLVRKRKDKLVIAGHYFPSPDFGIFSIANERNVLHSVEIGKNGRIWCDCDYMVFRKNKFSLCSHGLRGFCWLLDNGYEQFVKDVLKSYLNAYSRGEVVK